MARMYIDCRQYPSEMNCSVSIAADTKKELIDAAVQHAVAVQLAAHYALLRLLPQGCDAEVFFVSSHLSRTVARFFLLVWLILTAAGVAAVHRDGVHGGGGAG